MFQSLWLRQLAQRWSYRKGNRCRRSGIASVTTRRRVRPRLEVLEDRCLLTATITDLGLLPGADSSYAAGINADGDVVGESGIGNTLHAFLYSKSSGDMTDLRMLPGQALASATSINSAGQVVGWSGNSPDTSQGAHAFLYSNGQMTDLGTLPQGTWSVPSGIDGFGDVIGNTDQGPFLYKNGQLSDLNTILPSDSNWTLTQAYAVNDPGQILAAGSNYIDSYTGAVLVSSSGDVTQLPGVGGSPSAISSTGDVVGTEYVTENNNVVEHAYLYRNGQTTDLGTLPGYMESFANGINSSDQVVGFVLEPGSRPFLYNNGQMIDLNSLLPANSGWTLTSAQAINDSGEVIGSGFHNGSHGEHAFLMDLNLTNLLPTQLDGWTATGGVTFSYQVTGSTVPAPTQVSLYWSTTPDFSGAIGGPVYTKDVRTGTQGTTFGPFNVTADQLGTPPGAARYLVLVTDPNNVLGNFDPNENVKALHLYDMTVSSVSTTDSREAIVDYQIFNPTLATSSQPLQLGINRSSMDTYSKGTPTLVAMLSLSSDDLSLGPHELTLDLNGNDSQNTLVASNLTAPFAANPKLPSVLAVITDTSGNMPSGMTEIDGNAHFHIFVIATAVGGATSETDTPWIVNTDAYLQNVFAQFGGGVVVMPEGLPFDWHSFKPGPGNTVAGGEDLYNQIVQAASAAVANSQLQPNDKIDVELIAHSRGSAVIDKAMQELAYNQNALNEQLQHGFYQMTLLEPHPANTDTLADASINPLIYIIPGVSTVAKALTAFYVTYGSTLADPALIVPSRVNQLQDFYQKNSFLSLSSQVLPTYPPEKYFNLQGLSLANIKFLDPTKTSIFGADLSSSGMGHSEVPLWYVDNLSSFAYGSIPTLPTSARATPDSVGPATQLVVVPSSDLNTNNGGLATNSPFTLFVMAPDSKGSLVPTFTGSITLQLTNGSEDTMLGGTLAKNAVNGVATFADLALNNPGTGYTIQATSTGLTVGNSPPLDVTPDQLVVTTAPTGEVNPGSGFTLAVSAEDGSGNVDKSFNGTVAAALNTALSDSGSLGGTLTAQAANGVATFTGLSLSQLGDYTLSFTSSGVASGSTTIAVTQPGSPILSGNPTNQTVKSGTNVTFTASANGSPTPSVQWQVSTDGGDTFTNVSGASSAALTLNNVTTAMSGYKYLAFFTNSAGTVASTIATLTVQPVPPVITGNPSNKTVTVGQSATFTTTASGDPAPTVQWQVSTDGGNAFTNISGANSTTLTLNNVTLAMSGFKYQAVFTNSLGSVTSSAATLTVNVPPPLPPAPPAAPPPSRPAPATPIVPPLLALLNSFLGGGTLTVNANGTETLTDTIFGIPLIVSTFDSSGRLVSVTFFGIDITSLISSL